MEVSEVTHQSLSSLLADFQICQSCQIVDHDKNRCRVGYKCPNCGSPSPTGQMYFPLQTHSLINLMQEFYHTKGSKTKVMLSMYDNKPSNHRLAVIIFFCTLGEVLLQYFLEQCMDKTNIPRRIQDRLFNDSLFVKERIQKLFPALTGDKWAGALKELNKGSEINYVEVGNFYTGVVDKRNEFLHRGNQWVIPKEMPKQCIDNIWPLLSLFVALHNKYVAKVKEKRNTP